MRTLHSAVFVLATALLLPAPGAYALILNTTDVPVDDPDRAAIQFLGRHEVIVGSPEDGTFRPNDPITRGEILKVVLEAAGHGRIALLSTVSQESPFADVAVTHTLRTYILFARDQGYISGYEDGTFRPNANVTRAEAAKIVSNVLEAPAAVRPSPYVDLGATSLRPYVENLFGANWFTVPSERFEPNIPALRREVARMTYRALVANAAAAATGAPVPWSPTLPEPATTPSDWRGVEETGLQFMIPAGWNSKTATLTFQNNPMPVLAASPFPQTEDSIPVLGYMQFTLPTATQAPEQAIQEAFGAAPYTRVWINVGDGETLRQVAIYRGYVLADDIRAAVWFTGATMHTVIYVDKAHPGMDTTFLRSVQHALELSGM